jgi:Tfp pilus assembly protein PilP
VTTASKTKHAGVPTKRDPFVSPVQSRSNTPLNCGTGKRCLVLDQTRLEGIVKAPNGMIAVVANTANKAYFLRENDPVYNGFVMRITPDSVVFRETMTDRLGKKSTREVVKRVNAPAV